MASLWFSGKEMVRTKKLSDYMGRNDKTRAVIKLQKIGQGAPGREPVMTEAEQKEWMLHAYRKQEDLKVGGGQCLSSALQEVDSKSVSSVDSNICQVEPSSSAPTLPLEDEEHDKGSSLFVSRMLNKSCWNGESGLRSLPKGTALPSIRSNMHKSDYDVFNIYK